MLVEQHKTLSRYLYLFRCLYNTLKVLCLQSLLTLFNIFISALAPFTIFLKLHITELTSQFKLVIKPFYKRLNLYFHRDYFPDFYKLDF